MLPNVQYDRSERVYVVTMPDGRDNVTFPSGRDGRQQAFQTAVAFENIRLYRMAQDTIENAPLLESRVWRACELVLTGGVDLVEDGDIVATVASSNEYGDYIVRLVDGQWGCDCEDWQSQMAPYDETGPRCKHTLAAEYAKELLKLRCYHCQHPNELDAEHCEACGELVTPF